MSRNKREGYFAGFQRIGRWEVLPDARFTKWCVRVKWQEQSLRKHKPLDWS